jgi:penicillin-binding protein 1A
LRTHFDEAVAERRELAGGRDALWLWDLAAVQSKDLTSESNFVQQVAVTPLKGTTRVRAVVLSVDSVTDEMVVDVGCCAGVITLNDLQWARPFGPGAETPAPRDIAQVARAGDLITVDVKGVLPQLTKTRRTVSLTFVAEPKVEGALVAIDPHTRFVRALVGGYKSGATGFNRATQALRQPGSAFKPVVYAAGLENRLMTPASICPDTPIVIRDAWTGKAWKPENYEDGKYDGNITYRTALLRSKNTCSVKLIEKLTPEKVIDVARRMGITSQLPENLTLALGTGDVTPLELTNAYTTIAAQGLFAEPLFVRKVVDADGTVLEDNHSQTTPGIDPAVAFVLTSMMRSVVEEGTATRALSLERPVAGKTGTTNQSRNVWFAGFSPELVAAVWVGFDDNKPLGNATGASTALPMWIGFMGEALRQLPKRDFVPPPDVVFLKMNPDTGSPTQDVTGVEQAFIAGTEPTERNEPLPSIFIEDEPL